MKLKLNEDGSSAVITDGKPIYTVKYEDGEIKEEPFDLSRLMMKVGTLNNEAKEHREAKEALQTEYEDYQSKYAKIEDPEKAIEALQTVAQYNQSQLDQAEEIEKAEDRMRATLNTIFETDKEKLKETYQKNIDDLSSQLNVAKSTINYNLKKSAFEKSKFFSQRDGNAPLTVLPPETAVDTLGKYFEVEGQGSDAKLMGYWNKEPIASQDPTKLAEPANFDESVEFILKRHPEGKRLLRATHGGPGGVSEGNEFYTEGKDVKLSKEQALDPQAYRHAKDIAAKQGGQVIFEK